MAQLAGGTVCIVCSGLPGNNIIFPLPTTLGCFVFSVIEKSASAASVFAHSGHGHRDCFVTFHDGPFAGVFLSGQEPDNPENSDGDDFLYDSQDFRTSVEAFAYLEGGFDAVHAARFPPDAESACVAVCDSVPFGSSDFAVLLRAKVCLTVPTPALTGSSACAPPISLAPCNVWNCLLDPSSCPLALVLKESVSPPVPIVQSSVPLVSSHVMLRRSQNSRGGRRVSTRNRGGRR